MLRPVRFATAVLPVAALLAASQGCLLLVEWQYK